MSIVRVMAANLQWMPLWCRTSVYGRSRHREGTCEGHLRVVSPKQCYVCLFGPGPMWYLDEHSPEQNGSRTMVQCTLA